MSSVGGLRSHDLSCWPPNLIRVNGNCRKAFAELDSVFVTVRLNSEDCQRYQTVPECVFALFKVQRRQNVDSTHFITPPHRSRCFLFRDFFSLQEQEVQNFDGNFGKLDKMDKLE